MSDRSSNKLSNDDIDGLIVHAYNNFLSGMMGYSELALLDCENPTQIEYLNQSMESGYEAVHFGKTLLASIGRLQANMKDFKLEELLAGALNMDNVEINLSGFELHKTTLIRTNIDWFKECLVCLVDFLTKYSKANQIEISFDLDKKKNKLNVALVVDGCSLSNEDAQNLFVPFYSSKNILGEKDIGLSKAKGFFGQMNAELSWVNGEGFLLDISLR